MWLVRESFGEIRAIGFEQTFLLPPRSQMAHDCSTRSRSTNFVNVVKTPRMQKIFAFSQITLMWMEVRFAEQARSVTHIPKYAHPRLCRLWQGVLQVRPHMGVVRIQTSRQGHPSRDANRRRR